MKRPQSHRRNIETEEVNKTSWSIKLPKKSNNRESKQNKELANELRRKSNFTGLEESKNSPSKKKRRVIGEPQASKAQGAKMSDASLASSMKKMTLKDIMQSDEFNESPILSKSKKKRKSYDSSRGDELPESSSDSAS